MILPKWCASKATILPVGALVLGCLLAGAPVATADEPVLHHVKYTVFTERPFPNAEIYYRNVDPPSFAAYSHDPYVFSPNVEANLGPDSMWTLDVTLANPNQWAMVTATSMQSPQTPNFHCVLAVDGQVVITNQGPKGVLCSVRNW